MKLSRITRAGSAVAIGALALTLAACGSDDNSNGAAENTSSAAAGGGDLSGELNGAGSSAQGSAMDAWRSGFQSANNGVTVNYDPIGSGDGVKNFISGAVQYAGSDAYLSDDDIASAKTTCQGGDVVELPVYISPIAIVFNLKGIDSLNLDAATVAGIFNGKITKWNDPAIAKLNDGVSLPSTAITPVHRSDDSGTTQNFTEWIKANAADAWPYDPSKTFPVKGGQSAEKTSGIIQTVTAGQGTISYADASQVGTLGSAKIKVGDSFVAHSPEGAAAAVSKSKMVEGRAASDIAIDIDRTLTDASTYPLVLVSYDIACTTYTDANTAKLVKGLFSYIISSEGQQAAASAAGSAPISQDLFTKAEAAVNAIKTS
ncbi:phosphate ABC transporter substrate-binding protein PstS [Luteimicrobium subarcticum]|uniref:phosphate ABC transporter substrate-binding protein PstS n=1 Tax=Luteimicrobium subarcticum TaxID=620910 RepID=UPI001FE8C4AF|nr:phosphate ABC transporter substrate-binding protein PstS [Luteimicrobium subarcticum]